jgi:formate dehydrogenase iron-sulfur subunit
MANEKAILVDTTKCTACRACQVACKQWNQNGAEKTTNRGSYENPPSLGSQTWMRILFNEHYDGQQMRWLFTKHQCMHCTDAACVSVCPSGATQQQEVKLADGAVVKRVATDPKKCVGCNYCRVACPFDVPGYNQKKRGIYRCTMCLDRVSNATPGYDQPACVKACAPGTLSFGNRAELIAKAELKVAALKKAGFTDAQVYGKTQVKGTRYLYILTSSPADYNLPVDPSIPASVQVWKTLSKPYCGLAAVGLVAALVVNGVINARNRGLEEKYKLEK